MSNEAKLTFLNYVDSFVIVSRTEDDKPWLQLFVYAGRTVRKGTIDHLPV
ncbi:MAG: hypothetical protein M1339_07435 [Bacteroidetes bacterium]|nr:hypothetical protein [Bacteroidota bacterium]